jgi:predicted  nucleic acid-binding Zn-ribbon protein
MPAVTNESSTALAANPDRLSATIVNNNAFDVTIRRGTPAVFGFGIILKAGGGSYEINAMNLYKGVITAIAEEGQSGTLSVEEGV